MTRPNKQQTGQVVLSKSLLTLLIPCLVLLLWSGKVQGTGVFVHGFGYPPIKAASKRQALLMAQRAAVLDGYARILQQQVAPQDGSGSVDKLFADDLTGFVRSAELVEQTYYDDGKVEVVLKIGRTTDKEEQARPLGAGDKERKGYKVKAVSLLPGNKQGSIKVSREEWLQILEKIVTFSTH